MKVKEKALARALRLKGWSLRFIALKVRCSKRRSRLHLFADD